MMTVERFYLGCLAHASYLIHSEGEAAVIDPQRDVGIYLEAAERLGVSIRWVMETHLHADFVSGHLELAQRTGAVICLGDGSGAQFAHRALRDGDTIPLGAGHLTALATPGHTLESICLAAYDPAQSPQPFAVFTGDTLFIGDVGRPDLSPTHTPQQLAALLYDSLERKLLPLPDETVVYPAHGAGSLCGRQMSNEASSTIGKERRLNYALQVQDRESFVELLTAELPPRPAYFHDEVERNRAGALPLDELPAVERLSPAEVAQRMAEGATVLDTRPTMQFAAAHVPGSIHVGLQGQFASWAARILGLDTPLLLVAEDDPAIEESRIRLARVGVENVVGALAGGVTAWVLDGRETSFVPQVSVQELAEWRVGVEPMLVLDVREPAERAAGFIEGSVSIPLPQLRDRLAELPRDRMLFVHCKGGYRSSAAASLLRRSGFAQAVNVTGGYDAWRTAFGAGTNAS